MSKTYVYCPRRSNGALELCNALGAQRLRKFDGIRFRDKGNRRFNIESGDVIICWGATVPEIEGVKVLNSMDSPLDKFEEIKRLLSVGINTVRIFKPGDLDREMRASGAYLGRTRHHQGGTDLLAPVSCPDFYAYRENFVKEYRIHSFLGRSIRAGEKGIREGFTLTSEAEWRPDANLAHPWVRSYDAGWRIKYEGFQSNMKMRRLAHAGVSALGLQFGAVDIGEDSLGNLKIIEINRAPGIEGGTVGTYVRAITRWIERGTNDAERASDTTDEEASS